MRAEVEQRPMTPPQPKMTGPIAWMAQNPVAANLLMLALLVAGLLSIFLVKKEVFPDIEVDAVAVLVAYPGASPEEVERGILLAIEEQVRDVEGVTAARVELVWDPPWDREMMSEAAQLELGFL